MCAESKRLQYSNFLQDSRLIIEKTKRVPTQTKNWEPRNDLRAGQRH
jgi:hypothetical protein